MLARTFHPIPHGKRRSFKPDFIVDSIAKIDFAYFAKLGIKAVLIDLDGTVVPHGTFEVSSEITTHLRQQTVKIYIATNRPQSRSLKNLQHALYASGVVHPHGFYAKPLPQYFTKAARDHNLDPREVMMIGDRYLQDIFGANSAGITTVAVRKLDRPSNPFDALLSRLEERYTNRLAKRYTDITD